MSSADSLSLPTAYPLPAWVPDPTVAPAPGAVTVRPSPQPRVRAPAAAPRQGVLPRRRGWHLSTWPQTCMANK